ncbi:cell wall-binding repeat-containing protein [Bacillus carboniphilus]|uniref:Cell wall-binding repeat-containing protein n=2 Tax=Bacillus carboniphilus TaxID=86663 RepID=A0ABY9K353_9BACI|nr:cell wall-binding repeat-containing protein [Bacillus carboniphilus]WLR44341.1 cell wall-binding repeat-containing protein [Bacillus carboniphilus]
MAQLPEATRLAGDDRYQTSIAVSNHFDEGADHQYIATGEKFADALTGAALAAKNGTGVLLVGTSVHEELQDFLTEKQPNLLTIFGGTVAVSEDVEGKLHSLFK